MEYENTAGSLKISSEVVASIAEYAVKEVEGVACLAPIVSNIGWKSRPLSLFRFR
mgnify:CR=1 FL=1